MILQNIVYPSAATFEEEMYVRRDKSGVTLLGEEGKIETSQCLTTIKFDTYFNTFSYKKWKKYTKLENVFLQIDLKGKARVMLTTLELHGLDVDEYIVYSEIIDSVDRKTYLFKYPDNMEVDALTFQIQPLADNLSIYNGAYITELEEMTLPDINLSLVICTYKREDYIRKNMSMLDRDVFENSNSILHGHLNVYISDNGNTLNSKEFSQKNIRIIPNKNSGGSGGFSRGAIEVINDKDTKTSHIIFMDDDITFDADALERNYSFLRLLKEEYDASMLGGAMFRTDRRFIQHAAGETYTIDGIVFNKAGYNMYSILDIMRNEIEEPINYLGWWYCCIPIGVFEYSQYSLPLFVQFDDIEFSLRNENIKKITLNGICCWHLPFDKKWSGFKNYYTIRNRAIVNSICFEKYNKRKLKRQLFEECARKIFQYSYREANLALLAVEDYLKGFSWLKEQDPVVLNNKVISLSDKLVDIGKLSVKFNHRELKLNRTVDEKQRHLILRLITLNGWIFPANKNVTVEVDNPRLQYMYRAKRVFKYDINTGKGLVIEKSYVEVLKIIKRFMKINKEIDKNFDRVIAEYKEMRSQVITEEFWRKFLDF